MTSKKESTYQLVPDQSMELHDCVYHNKPMQWEIDLQKQLKKESEEARDRFMKEWNEFLNTYNDIPLTK